MMFEPTIQITSHRLAHRLLLGAGLLAGTAGCGAKTGLEIPSLDAGGPVDGGDPVVDDACPERPVALIRPPVETVFLVDRSGSMGTTWDGRDAGIGLPSRWELVRDALAGVLPAYDDRPLRMGAKLFPTGLTCDVAGGLDVDPAPGSVPDVIALFDRFVPEGATPAAQALDGVIAELASDGDAPGAVVLVMDGGPNCNEDPPEPPETCTCTGPRRSCLAGANGALSCLDEVRMITVLERANRERGVPVFVLGIDDPTRPELTAFLDEMAVAGGFPRPLDEGRRFYVAREPVDLEAAFERITDVLARCVLAVPTPPPLDARVDVTVDGSPLPRDPDRIAGWDWTDENRGAMGFFGATCDALRAGDPDIRAQVVCE